MDDPNRIRFFIGSSLTHQNQNECELFQGPFLRNYQIYIYDTIYIFFIFGGNEMTLKIFF
jgi:hypothetical protein